MKKCRAQIVIIMKNRLKMNEKTTFHVITIDKREPKKITDYFHELSPLYLGEYNYEIKNAILDVGDILIETTNAKIPITTDDKIRYLADKLIGKTQEYQTVNVKMLIERKTVFDLLGSLYSNHLNNQLRRLLDLEDPEMMKYLFISGQWWQLRKQLSDSGRINEEQSVKLQYMRTLSKWDALGIRSSWLPTDRDLVTYSLMRSGTNYEKIIEYKLRVDPVDKKIEPMVRALVSMIPGANIKTIKPIAIHYNGSIKQLIVENPSNLELSNIIRSYNGKNEQKTPLKICDTIINYINGKYD